MTSAIRLIAALGNPGDKYASTRHNAGVWLLERILGSTGAQLAPTKVCSALTTAFTMQGQALRVIFPQSYMNNSGREIGQFMRYYQIPPEALLVLHDELDFVPGVIRLKVGGGCAGHNGLKDIKCHLGSTDFVRLRIGIGRPNENAQVADYVLKKPAVHERQLIDEAITIAEGFMPELVSGGVADIMQRLHTSN